MSLHIIILAAGAGKRMHSKLPKVLHTLAGEPMLARVVRTAKCLQPQMIHVIIGHGSEQVKKSLAYLDVHWIEQTKQEGTGHATMHALPFIPDEASVLILSGDVPLISEATLQALITQKPQGSPLYLNLLVAELDNPHGLGRIVRDKAKHVNAIVEEKDATMLQRKITEIYSGICYTSAEALNRWLPKLTANNAQSEYYLTDIIALAVKDKVKIHTQKTQDSMEIQGINNRYQLQQLERHYQQNLAKQWMLAGVGIADEHRLDIRGDLSCGMDVFLDINVILTGKVQLGHGVKIGANCLLTNVTIGDFTEVLPNSVLDGCMIGEDCRIGPFARLRPGTTLGHHCKIGNFVETKKASFGEHSQASHLSYLG